MHGHHGHHGGHHRGPCFGPPPMHHRPPMGGMHHHPHHHMGGWHTPYRNPGCCGCFLPFLMIMGIAAALLLTAI